MKNSIVITAVVAIIIGAGAFFGGMKYQESRLANSRGQFRQQGGQAGGRGQFGQRFNGRGAGARAVAGEVISLDEKSITVKLPDNSSKIVLLTDATTISKSAEGTKSDLKTGERVAVFGTTNSDGSVTAQNVQLNPWFSEMRNNLPSPSPTP